MNNITKRILTIVFIMAVLAYIIFSYMNGKSETGFFLIATAMLSYFLISMVAELIGEIRER
jgi:hypothetical protein